MASSASSGCSHRRWGPLPLIKCPCCEWRDVKRFTSNTEDNPNHDFVKCPNHRRGKGGCKFWFWVEDYVEYIRRAGILVDGADGLKPLEAEMEKILAAPEVEKEKIMAISKASSADMEKIMALLVALLGLGKEIVFILKTVAILLVLVLFVLVLKK